MSAHILRNTILICCSAISLSACLNTPLSIHNTPRQPHPAAENDGTSQQPNRIWQLSRLDGFERSDFIAAKAIMDWTRLPQAHAYMGCNRLSFTADTVSNGQLTVSRTVSTRMACADMPLEAAFLTQLQQSTTYRLEGHRLILIGSNGKEMHFIAQDWD